MNRTKTEAVAQADAYLNNVDLPTYTEVIGALRACQMQLRIVIDYDLSTESDKKAEHQAASLLIKLAEVLP